MEIAVGGVTHAYTAYLWLGQYFDPHNVPATPPARRLRVKTDATLAIVVSSNFPKQRADMCSSTLQGTRRGGFYYQMLNFLVAQGQE